MIRRSTSLAVLCLTLGCRAPAPSPTPIDLAPTTSAALTSATDAPPRPHPSVTSSSRARTAGSALAPTQRRRAKPAQVQQLRPYLAQVASRHEEVGAVRDVAVLDSAVLAATDAGLQRRVAKVWTPVPGLSEPALAVIARGDAAWVLAEDGLYVVRDAATRVAPLPAELGEPVDLALGERVLVVGARTLWAFDDGALGRLEAPPLAEGEVLRQVAESLGGARVAVTSAGLFFAAPGSLWERLRPRAGVLGWDPIDVRAAAFDAEGRLWFSSPQGVGVRDPAGGWRLIAAGDLPWNGFSLRALAPCQHGAWFGTDRGALHLRGGQWEYRQGKRWLPGDDVRALAVDPETQAAWFATDAGLGAIRRERWTLSDKAAHFETALETRHMRTPLGYVAGVGLPAPGDLSTWAQRDTDNDGLWTGMHGAAACFAWAATGDPNARRRAARAFEALRFLSQVTQGGEHPAPPGFPARAVRPRAEGDPNGPDALARDRSKRAERDALWRVYAPRWPLSADGAWYWKSDTSSDELDGHFFFYAQYYDLVADTDAERARVRETVTAIVDHLLAHGLRLVDHAGPTRWANFAPASLNHDPAWHAERALNSLSILSYLAVAEHVSGDPRYRDAARRLIDEHGYAQNVLGGKLQQGPGTGNQSDDEMAVMSFYDLLLYEQDPALLQTYRVAFKRYWEHVEPEGNPFFALAYAASCAGEQAPSPWGPIDLSPSEGWLEQAVDALRRLPLDRVRWGLRNSHRLDLARLPGPRPRGRRRDGRALPLDERWVEHWNQDPYALDYPYDGRVLADGTVFLLPYYLGRYHGFLEASQ